jgi:DNA methylase
MKEKGQLPLVHRVEKGKPQGPVECLGMTFPTDEARRQFFLEKLREKLQDPEFRKIEGFPIGSDEDILSISDPPYYTACPNPFLRDFIKSYGKPYDPATDNYRREPFAADVSEGKNDPIYQAHSYHTKVPPRAIVNYLEHYTNPGDIVFDGFCGTGMTGVAAQLCKHPRRSILSDLSPAATFFAYNFAVPMDAEIRFDDQMRALREVKQQYEWMFETKHENNQEPGKVNYTVWSDVFVCPECGHEVVFWDSAVDMKSFQVLDSFSCLDCKSNMGKNDLDRAFTSVYDPIIGKMVREAKRVPVLIHYYVGSKAFIKRPSIDDYNLLKKIDELAISVWCPIDPLPQGDKTNDPISVGVTHVHHF